MFIHVNGVRLFYEKQGTGKPLILLHGNEENHRIFDEAIELLKKHYTVYAVDSRDMVKVISSRISLSRYGKGYSRND